jgi:hypothetical protein
METHVSVLIYGNEINQSAVVGGEWSASRPCHFTPGEKVPSTHWIGDWVGLRAGLGDMENRKCLNLPRIELRTLGCLAAHIQLLYLLHYPGSSVFSTGLKIKTGGKHETLRFSRIKPHMLTSTNRTFTSIIMLVHDSNKLTSRIFYIRLVLSGAQPFILTGPPSFQAIIINSDP